MNADISSEEVDLDVKYQDLDSAELFLLQNAYKTMQGFLDLTCGVHDGQKPTPTSAPMIDINSATHKRHDSITALLMPSQDSHHPSKRSGMEVKTLFNKKSAGESGKDEDMNIDGVSYNEHTAVASALAVSQDKLKRMTIRLEILENIQVGLFISFSLSL